MIFSIFRLFRFLPRAWWSPAAWKTWMSYSHWRMETYGVYFPGGQRNPAALRELLRQLPSYLRWLTDLDRLHRSQK